MLIADFGLQRLLKAELKAAALQRSGLALLRPPRALRAAFSELLKELGQALGGADVKLFWLSERPKEERPSGAFFGSRAVGHSATR